MNRKQKVFIAVVITVALAVTVYLLLDKKSSATSAIHETPLGPTHPVHPDIKSSVEKEVEYIRQKFQETMKLLQAECVKAGGSASDCQKELAAARERAIAVLKQKCADKNFEAYSKCKQQFGDDAKMLAACDALVKAACAKIVAELSA